MGEMIRCKFICHAKTERLDYMGRKVYTYEFSPVATGSEENKAFYSATPSGKLEIGTILMEAFEIGKSYYMDIQVAPEP